MRGGEHALAAVRRALTAGFLAVVPVLVAASAAQAAPTVSELSPHSGYPGQTVTITGTEMEAATSVTFGAPPGTTGIELMHLSPTSISVRVPLSITTGLYDVYVHDELGDEVFAGTFLYEFVPGVSRVSPKKGPAAGGTVVTITGNDLGKTSEVLFGSVPGTIESESPHTLVAISPPHTVGKYGVTLVDLAGSSGPSKQAMFTFSGVTVTGVSPASGVLAGGNPVTVTGSGFALGAGTTAFTFGKIAAGEAECASTTECTVLAPAGAKAATVDVRATVAGAKGTSKKSPADHYSYE